MSELSSKDGAVPLQCRAYFFFGGVGVDPVTGLDKIYFIRGISPEEIEQIETDRVKNKNIVVENLTDAAAASSDVKEEYDYIYQHILHASKLFEGRVSIEDIATKYTIPEVRQMVKIEMANYYESQQNFKNKREINVYTKDEALSAANLLGGIGLQ